MKKYVLTVCLVALLLPGCKPKPEVNDESSSDSLSILSDGGLYNDSLVLSRPAIVFYQPGEVQIDSMLGSDPNAGIADANSDFIYYSGLATDSLRNTDSIAVMYTNKRFIYSPLSGGSHHLTDRQQDKLIFGMLITDGQRNPLIVNGVKTDQEYIREALNYLKK